jgi:hypothetical protein
VGKPVSGSWWWLIIPLLFQKSKNKTTYLLWDHGGVESQLWGVRPPQDKTLEVYLTKHLRLHQIKTGFCTNKNWVSIGQHFSTRWTRYLGVVTGLPFPCWANDGKHPLNSPFAQLPRKLDRALVILKGWHLTTPGWRMFIRMKRFPACCDGFQMPRLVLSSLYILGFNYIVYYGFGFY